MTTPVSNFQFDRNESLRGLLLPIILFAGAVVIQFKMAWHLGFVGFDFSFVPPAGFQESLSAMLSREAHESLLVRFLESLTAQGYLGPKIWQGTTLFFHYLNAVFAYFVARRVLHGQVGVSLAIAALVGMNPLGMEALVWGCCLHIILTLTWIFLGLLIYRYHSHVESTWITALRAIGLVILQITAFFIWDWGIIFFPIVALIALSSPNEASKKMRKRYGIILLTSVGLVWLIGSSLVLGLSEISKLSFLPITTILQNLFMAPVEGLFPLLKTDLFYSWIGVLLALGVYAILIGLVVFCLPNLSLIGAMLISFIPWVFFHEPEGSDFYLSLPFLYLCIASLKELKNSGIFILFVYLFFQFIWMYERVQIIEKGVVPVYEEDTAFLLIPFKESRR
ncbi:MAG: hypothetical protein K940chlam3_00805 [Chlamydiae bacterium]|nr:hypothetical protein [Chlamydiota bacterium]